MSDFSACKSACIFKHAVQINTQYISRSVFPGHGVRHDHTRTVTFSHHIGTQKSEPVVNFVALHSDTK